MRVLIVEDDKYIRDVLFHVVESLGHIPFTADNEEEATKTLYIARPDTILLDLMLHGVIATPLIELIRQTMKESPPRIIVISAMREAKNLAEANHAEFLSKPFDINQLEQILNSEMKKPQAV